MNVGNLIIFFWQCSARYFKFQLATEQSHMVHVDWGGGVKDWGGRGWMGGRGGGLGPQTVGHFAPRALPTVDKPSRRRHQKPRVLSRHPRIWWLEARLRVMSFLSLKPVENLKSRIVFKNRQKSDPEKCCSFFSVVYFLRLWTKINEQQI